jgi:hypothetical protein
MALACQPPLASADDWCQTYEQWIANVGNERMVASGTCPTEGSCDVPSVRDSWIPNGSTPIVTIRIKFIIFCNDDGTNCAADSSAHRDSHLFCAGVHPSAVGAETFHDDRPRGAGGRFFARRGG